MTRSNLPAVTGSGSPARDDPSDPAVGIALEERRRAPPPPDTPRVPAAVVVGIGAFVVGLVAVLGLASLVGEPVRNAVLLETDVSPADSELRFSDAPAEAAAFFAVRDSVSVRVPWDMTVGDFLAVYHLEAHDGVREALGSQLGAWALDDPLREGERVRLALNLTRPSP